MKTDQAVEFYEYTTPAVKPIIPKMVKTEYP